MGKALIINTVDNVATSMCELHKGEIINNGEKVITLENVIPIYHKFAIKNIQKNDDVIKYGEVIGRAIRDIKVGEYVHVHNIVSKR